MIAAPIAATDAQQFSINLWMRLQRQIIYGKLRVDFVNLKVFARWNAMRTLKRYLISQWAALSKESLKEHDRGYAYMYECAL